MKHEQKTISDDLFQPAAIDEREQEQLSRESISFWRDAWRRLLKNKGAVISLFFILFIIAMAFIGPVLNDYTVKGQNVERANLPAKVPFLENISWLGFDGVDIRGVDQYEQKEVESYFWFGTDSLGRDIWTKTWEGTQISLYIAFLAATLDLLIGVAYGGISAFYGGRVDNVMQRIIEILVGIPNLIIIILMILILDPGITAITLALVITGWVNMARVVRGQILKLKGQEFILASRTLGARHNRLILKHLIPNVLGQVIITTMFTIPNAIFFEAFLSFIGLGLQPPDASLGTLINEGFQSLQIYPHMVWFPAIVISLIMISFNVLGDGLRDALDPRMRR